MKRILICLRILLSICSICILCISSSYTMEDIKKNNYKELLTPKKENWTGIIEVWHIVGFKPFQGSITTFLQEIAQTVEAKHPGVYINVTGMEWNDALQKIKRGKTPDLWSFSSGQLYAEQLTKLNTDTTALGITEFFLNLGEVDGVYAVPYTYSGYFIIGNTQLIQSNFLPMKSLDDLQQCIDQADKQLACDSPHIAAQLGLTAQLVPSDVFKSGKTAYGIVDARTLGDLCRKQDQKIIFDVICAIPYTNQIQYIGISPSINEAKEDHIIEYINSIFSEKSQANLANLGLFPVIHPENNPIYSNDYIEKAKQVLNNPQMINTFVYHSIKDKLDELAISALTGNTASKKDFSVRWSEVINK